jgi:hypothetical protein
VTGGIKLAGSQGVSRETARTPFSSDALALLLCSPPLV